MLRRCFSALLVIGFMMVARPLLAAEGASALDAVSADASVVIRLKNPKASIDKLADFVDSVQPPFGTNVRQFARAIGASISNPTLAGVDMTKDWYVAAYKAAGDAEPVVVYVIPATDIKAMQKGLGDDVKFAANGSWGVYSTDADAIEKAGARIKGDGKSISTVIDKESTAAMDRADFSVFVNVAQLVSTHTDEIAKMKENAHGAIDQIPDQQPAGSPVDPKAVAELAKTVLGGFIEAIEDTTGIVAALTVTNEGLSFEELLRVKSGSGADKWFQRSSTSPMAVLGTLPSGKLGYFGLNGDVNSMMKLMGTMFTASGEGDSADQIKAMKSLFEDLGKLKFGTLAGEFGLGTGKEGVINSAMVTEVDNPEKMREIQQKSMKNAQTAKTPGIKQEFDFKPNAEKYGKNSADVITMKMTVEDANSPEAEMASRVFKLLFGSEGGMTTRMIYLKDRVVQVMGGTKEDTGKILEGLEQKSASGNDAFKGARGQLTDKANLIILFDLPGTLVSAARIAVESGELPIPIDASALDDLKMKPSYMGFSVATEPQGVRCKSVIPVEQLRGLARIAMLAVTLQAGGGAPPPQVEVEVEEKKEEPKLEKKAAPKAPEKVESKSKK